MNQTHSSKGAFPELVRALGPWMATAVVVGTIIGSGIYKKPQSIAAVLPNFSLIALVWILGGLLSLLGSLALAEVAVLFPRSGGNYVYLREGYGRLAGFLWGWVEFWIIRAASLAALATIFTESLMDILRQTGAISQASEEFSWDRPLITVTILLALAGVNIRGVRWGGGLQLFITAVKAVSLLAIMMIPYLLWKRWSEPGPTLTAVQTVGLLGAGAGEGPLLAASHLAPSSTTFTWGGLSTALVGVLWAYHGWMNIAPVAGEVKNPQRNLPLAFLAGTGIVIFLYLGANLAYHLVIPQNEMAKIPGTTSTAAEFGFRFFGSVGTILAAAAVMCSVFGALNGNLLVGPRLLYAMGQDGLAPRALSGVHPRFHTPALAIAVMAGWSIILVLAASALKAMENPSLTLGDYYTLDLNLYLKKPLFDILTDYCMFGAVIFETLAVTTIFVFRSKLAHAQRPYHCPGYPWVPALYLILPAFIIGNMFLHQQVEAAVGVGFILLGAAVYFIKLGHPQRGISPEPADLMK